MPTQRQRIEAEGLSKYWHGLDGHALVRAERNWRDVEAWGAMSDDHRPAMLHVGLYAANIPRVMQYSMGWRVVGDWFDWETDYEFIDLKPEVPVHVQVALYGNANAELSYILDYGRPIPNNNGDLFLITHLDDPTTPHESATADMEEFMRHDVDMPFHFDPNGLEFYHARLRAKHDALPGWCPSLRYDRCQCTFDATVPNPANPFE